MTSAIRLRDIIRLMIGALATELAVVMLLRLISARHFLVVAVAGSAGSLWWIVGYQRLARTRAWDGVRSRFSPVGGGVIVISALAGLLVIAAAAGLGALVQWAGIEIKDLPASVVIPTNFRDLPLAVAFAVVLGPFSEELIFRGLLLDWLRQTMAVGWAAVLISLFFALLHDMSFHYEAADWIAFAERSLLDVGASFLAIRTRSLRAPWVMHATLNGSACLASIYRGGA